jgi:HK97 family phage major capsid protein
MEVKELLETKLNKLGEDIDAKINAATETQKTNLYGELDKLKANELTALTTNYAEIQKQLDAISVKTNRIAGNERGKTFGEIFTEKLNNDAAFKAYRSRSAKSAQIDFNGVSMFSKAGDMNTGNSLTGDVIAPDRIPGIIFDPDRAQHVRDFIPTASTSSNVVYYVRESAFEDNTATVGESSTKPQSDFDLTQEEAPVRKIATYVRMSEEMLNDVAGMTGYLTARLPKKLRLIEDNQILYGNGLGQNLEGITEVASAYVDSLADANVNRFDVLVKAIAQVRADEYFANAIMVNPADWYNLLLIKSAEGDYLMPESARFGGQAPRVAGVPIIANTAVTSGDFLVGDFAQGVQLFDRLQSNIRFFDQDQDNAIKNLVTVVAEERLALATYRPTAFVYGTFAAALANGSA